MRLILDAHVSGPEIGEALRRRGHDVFSVDQHADLEGLSDMDVLALAAREGRVLVTANAKHFVPLVTDMNARGESHPGCVLIPRSIRGKDFGAIISGVGAVLEDTSQEDWTDRVQWIKR